MVEEVKEVEKYVAIEEEEDMDVGGGEDGDAAVACRYYCQGEEASLRRMSTMPPLLLTRSRRMI